MNSKAFKYVTYGLFASAIFFAVIAYFASIILAVRDAIQIGFEFGGFMTVFDYFYGFIGGWNASFNPFIPISIIIVGAVFLATLIFKFPKSKKKLFIKIGAVVGIFYSLFAALYDGCWVIQYFIDCFRYSRYISGWADYVRYIFRESFSAFICMIAVAVFLLIVLEKKGKFNVVLYACLFGALALMSTVSLFFLTYGRFYLIVSSIASIMFCAALFFALPSLREIWAPDDKNADVERELEQLRTLYAEGKINAEECKMKREALLARMQPKADEPQTVTANESVGSNLNING